MFQDILTHYHPIYTFFLLALAGVAAGRLFRIMKLPDISGQVLTGIVLGPAVLGIFSFESLEQISFIGDLALSVMTFIAGTHLNFKKLHNSGVRIVNLASADIVFTFIIVASALFFLTKLSTGLDTGAQLCFSLIAGAIAISTAPGTIISLIQRRKARGVLVNTLIGVVALTNVAAVVVFELCKACSIQVLSPEPPNIIYLLGNSFFCLFEDVIFGIFLGWLLSLATKHEHDDTDLFASIFLAIVAVITLCEYFQGLSVLLTSLAMGAAFSNMSYHTKRGLEILDGFNGIIFAIFFTIAGTHLNLGLLWTAGFAGVVFIVSRALAKVLSIYGTGRLLSYPPKVSKYLGMGLLPQAGLAVGLVVSLGELEIFNQSGLSGIVNTVILASVALNEIIGPFTVAKGFDKAGETGQAAPRLVDFLHEEYILTPIRSTEKWAAIRELCDFLVKTNHLKSISADDFVNSVIEREKSFSTGVGNKIAVPHAILPPKEQPVGVVGIAKTPIDFDAVDGKKVDIIILFATPKGQEKLHLKILSVVARIFGQNSEMHDSIVSAANAAEVYDILQSGEIRHINFFLEELV